ncbi:D-alanine--D-alanine ligase, partial [Patescibacteria group bacterium]|nr:D-alanine--D-alanine ligase [Patescibacteria group bacterium]
DVKMLEVNADAKWINDLSHDKPDFVFIALHGKYGEDGKVQAVLEMLGLKYNGSGVTASAVGFDKVKTYQVTHGFGLAAPKFLSVRGIPAEIGELEKVIAQHIGFPCIIKPSESGSSVGVTILEDGKNLRQALEASFKEDSVAIVQQFVKGRELTCGIMGNTGQTQLIALPLVEIIPAKGKFFDYEEKYKTSGNEICPAKVPDEISAKVQEMARVAHEALGCRGLTRSDFIWDETAGQIYFLEINTLPGQTKQSLCPKEAAAIGMSFEDFLEKQIQLGMM